MRIFDCTKDHLVTRTLSDEINANFFFYSISLLQLITCLDRLQRSSRMKKLKNENWKFLDKRNYLEATSHFAERYKWLSADLPRIDLFYNYTAATKRGKLYVFITPIKESKFCRHLAHRTVAPRLASECSREWTRNRGVACTRVVPR